jgi:hypothetical protein
MPLGMYQKKKKKIIDPNAPPRPTLLGHEKELKGWRDRFLNIDQQNIDQIQTINLLKRKVNRLQTQIDALISVVRRLK